MIVYRSALVETIWFLTPYSGDMENQLIGINQFREFCIFQVVSNSQVVEMFFSRAAAARHGPLGLIHVDAHSDTAENVHCNNTLELNITTTRTGLRMYIVHFQYHWNQHQHRNYDQLLESLAFRLKTWSKYKSRWWANVSPTGLRSDVPGRTDSLTTPELFRLFIYSFANVEFVSDVFGVEPGTLFWSRYCI